MTLCPEICRNVSHVAWILWCLWLSVGGSGAQTLYTLEYVICIYLPEYGSFDFHQGICLLLLKLSEMPVFKSTGNWNTGTQDKWNIGRTRLLGMWNLQGDLLTYWCQSRFWPFEDESNNIHFCLPWPMMIVIIHNYVLYYWLSPEHGSLLCQWWGQRKDPWTVAKVVEKHVRSKC